MSIKKFNYNKQIILFIYFEYYICNNQFNIDFFKNI